MLQVEEWENVEELLSARRNLLNGRKALLKGVLLTAGRLRQLRHGVRAGGSGDNLRSLLPEQAEILFVAYTNCSVRLKRTIGILKPSGFRYRKH